MAHSMGRRMAIFIPRDAPPRVNSRYCQLAMLRIKRGEESAEHDRK